MYFYN